MAWRPAGRWPVGRWRLGWWPVLWAPAVGGRAGRVAIGRYCKEPEYRFIMQGLIVSECDVAYAYD